MTRVHELSRRDARRIAVRAQLLSGPRPDDLLDMVRHLGLVQADTTAAVAPSAEMVAWPGVGPLRDWEEARRDWVEANDECRRDILDLLQSDGPLPRSAMPDTTVAPWESSGWNNDRNVRMLLGPMVQRGEIAMAGREGRERLWDLAERVYPDDPVVPLGDALRIRRERRLRSLGVARANDVGDVGEPAVIDGVRGRWRLDPSYLDLTFTGRAVLLSPLDRLVGKLDATAAEVRGLADRLGLEV